MRGDVPAAGGSTAVLALAPLEQVGGAVPGRTLLATAGGLAGRLRTGVAMADLRCARWGVSDSGDPAPDQGSGGPVTHVEGLDAFKVSMRGRAKGPAD